MSTYILCHSGTELYHHGILGQKWGVRRYQNKDGSLTEQGKKRYQKFDTKSYRKELESSGKRRDLSDRQRRSYIKSASADIKQADRWAYKAMQRQAKIEKQMADAERLNDQKALLKLSKKWVQQQQRIRYADELNALDPFDLGKSRRDYYLYSTLAGLPAGTAISNYLPTMMTVNEKADEKAMRDYGKYMKNRRRRK